MKYKFTINTLKEAQNELRFMRADCKKSFQLREKWKAEIKEAIEILEGKQLTLKLRNEN